MSASPAAQSITANDALDTTVGRITNVHKPMQQTKQNSRFPHPTKY